MASDRQQFKQAMDHWESLHEKELYSVPEKEGITAILASGYPFNLKTASKDGENREKITEAILLDSEDTDEFNAEAAEIAENLEEYGNKTLVIKNAKYSDAESVIRAKEVANIIFIGHGSLSDIQLAGSPKDVLDWKRVSELSTHLKTGGVEQRQCGIATRDLNVPLGMFVVSDFFKVRAAVGQIFEPDSLSSCVNSLITPVLEDGDELSYNFFKRE